MERRRTANRDTLTGIADYTLWRDIVRACHDARPYAVNVADLCGKFPDRIDELIRYHVWVLEDGGFLETRNLRSTTGNNPLAAIQYVRLSHPLAAARFRGRPTGPPN